MTPRATPFDDAFWGETPTLREKISDTATQVRNNVKKYPGPALLTAVVVGFLAGRAFCRNRV